MTLFSDKYPKSARGFGVSLAGYEAWESACADHNWLPADTRVYGVADSLMLYAASWYNAGDLFSSARFFPVWYKLRQEFATMARRKVEDQREKRATWQGFLDFKLDNEQLEEMDGWEPTPAEMWELVDRLMNDGYRLTLSYSVKLKTATCTVMDDDPKRKSGGWGLSSGDADGAHALKAALYKHFLVLEGTWDSLLDAAPSVGRRY